MGMEIERKFLLQSDTWRAQIQGSVRYRQAYLNQETSCSVRVRVSGEQAWLNIKGATIGAERLEFEYEIPLQDAHDMLDQLSKTPVIDKVRHFITIGPHTWEIDVFEGDNAGLIVAEIELNDAGETFEKPEWLGMEVTEDPRYYNTHLARHPYRLWPS